MSQEGNVEKRFWQIERKPFESYLSHMKFNSHTIQFVRQRNREYMTFTEDRNKNFVILFSKKIFAYLCTFTKESTQKICNLALFPKCEQLTFIRWKEIKGFHPSNALHMAHLIFIQNTETDHFKGVFNS